MPVTTGRLIPLASGEGAWNMSVDQALMESTDRNQVPILRFYSWSEPTLSLGYFQKLAERGQHLPSVHTTCVRRSTGGGAIMHHHELTYSLCVPTNPNDSGARLELYQIVHRAISESIQQFGVRAEAFRNDPSWNAYPESFLCFQRRTDEDIVVSGYKVVGSAQRRTKNAILQHGSILLSASDFAPELPGLCDLGMKGSGEGFLGEVRRRISAMFGNHWEESELTDQELQAADRIKSTRYAESAWLERR